MFTLNDSKMLCSLCLHQERHTVFIVFTLTENAVFIVFTLRVKCCVHRERRSPLLHWR